MGFADLVRALRNRLAERDDKLTEAEESVLAALSTGREGELVVGLPQTAPQPFRSVTARFLALTLSQGEERPFNRLRLVNLEIQGSLQLDAVDIRVRLYVEGCSLDGLNLDQSRLPELMLDRTTVGKLSATQCEILGGIRCRSGCRIEEVFLVGSKIHGNFDLRGAHVGGQQSVAVHGNGLTIGGNLLVCSPARLDGELRISQASIRGNLDLSGAWLGRVDGTAVGAQYLRVDGDVLLCRRAGPADDPIDRPTVCRGRVDLSGARIGGNLRAHGARLLAGNVWTPEGALLDDSDPETIHAVTAAGIGEIQGFSHALSLEGTEVVGSAHINQGFLAVGSVVLKHLRLGRDLFMNNAAILVASRYAIDANGARIRGSVDLRRGDASTEEWTYVDGVVSFDHAVIEGSFSADRTVFMPRRARHPNHWQEYSDPLQTIEMPVAAEDSNAPKLPFPFKAKRHHLGLNLRYAEIGRSLRLPESPVERLPKEVLALPEGEKLKMIWQKAESKIDIAPWAGRPAQDYQLNLENVRCARFVDDIRRWPAGLRSALFNDFDYGSLVNQAVGTTYSGVYLATLRNYTYQSVANDPNRDSSNRRWFRPQPYIHLLRFYDSAGQRSAVAAVGEQLGRQALRHRGGVMKELGRLLWFTGYGYRPARAVWGILALWIFATIVFSAAYDSGLMLIRPPQVVERALEERQMLHQGPGATRDTVIVFHGDAPSRSATRIRPVAPTRSLPVERSPRVGADTSTVGPAPDLTVERIYIPGVPPFLSAIYALDLVLPVVDLGMASVYGPGVYQLPPDEKRLCLDAKCLRWTMVTGLHAVVWLASLLGWTLGTLLVAALAGVLRR